MSPFIQAILFDLGGTLMYARAAWGPIESRADLAFAQSLHAQGLSIDPADFAAIFRRRLKEYYVRREESLFETTYLSVAKELLQEEGHATISEAGIRSALDALFSVTQQNWILEEDALPMLRYLEDSGYRLGLVSNAGDNQDVFRLAEKFGIEPFFDFILTSAACSYRKPHARIFELAMAHWHIPPGEIAMVGDTLEADILGAQNAGLFSIWITRRSNPKADHIHRIQADLTLPALSDLPSALDKLR
ncbi:MAG: HAD family hydrolase [Chloroflexota bacterium]